MKTYTSNDLVNALRRIGKYGKSEMSVDLFLKYICRDEEQYRRRNHSLAVAELTSRLAPEGSMDDWYVAGLLHEILDRKLPGGGHNSGIMKALLTKARIRSDIISGIGNYRRIRDPRKWTPLMTALNYADAHIDEEGNVLTTDDCCRLSGISQMCNACMYARYLYSLQGYDKAAEDITLKLIEDMRSAENEQGRVTNNGR